MTLVPRLRCGLSFLAHGRKTGENACWSAHDPYSCTRRGSTLTNFSIRALGDGGSGALEVKRRTHLPGSIAALVKLVNYKMRHPRFLAHAVHDVPVHGTGNGLGDGLRHMVTVGVEVGSGVLRQVV